MKITDNPVDLAAEAERITADLLTHLSERYPDTDSAIAAAGLIGALALVIVTDSKVRGHDQNVVPGRIANAVVLLASLARNAWDAKDQSASSMMEWGES